MGELKKSADEWKAIIKGSFELELEPYRNVLGGWLKNLPKFENMGDAMRHAISASEYQISKGVVAVPFYGGTTHPLSRRVIRLKKYGVLSIAVATDEVVNYEDAWSGCFNTRMRHQKIKNTNITIETLVIDVVHKHDEFGDGWDEIYYNEYREANPET